MGQSMNEEAGFVVLPRFIQATRDSGYKGTSSAIAELVDNAIQAGASRVRIMVRGPTTAGDWFTLGIADDGGGMDAASLRRSLRFGGSGRFNDRGGLGRYGMGLPNSSLSQARRVEVLSRRAGAPLLSTYLDLDEIALGELREVPAPAPAEAPSWASMSESGTVVIWSRCDRLDYKHPKWLIKRLVADLGRIFRHFIWSGVRLQVNDQPVEGIDPLFLHSASVTQGALPFGSRSRCRSACPMSAALGRSSGTYT